MNDPRPHPIRPGPGLTVVSHHNPLNHHTFVSPDIRPPSLRLYGTISRRPIQARPDAHTPWMLQPTPPARVSQLPPLVHVQDTPICLIHNYLSTASAETRLAFPSSSLNASRQELPSMSERASPVDELARESSPPSKEMQDEDTTSEGFTPLCEYSTPCQMSTGSEGVYFRKVVSHLFGRNKTSTKLFPQHVWVLYCRRHYQRARYRAE